MMHSKQLLFALGACAILLLLVAGAAVMAGSPAPASPTASSSTVVLIGPQESSDQVRWCDPNVVQAWLHPGPTSTPPEPGAPLRPVCKAMTSGHPLSEGDVRELREMWVRRYPELAHHPAATVTATGDRHAQ
jgi:hypothetical protein